MHGLLRLFVNMKGEIMICQYTRQFNGPMPAMLIRAFWPKRSLLRCLAGRLLIGM